MEKVREKLEAVKVKVERTLGVTYRKVKDKVRLCRLTTSG